MKCCTDNRYGSGTHKTTFEFGGLKFDCNKPELTWGPSSNGINTLPRNYGTEMASPIIPLDTRAFQSWKICRPNSMVIHGFFIFAVGRQENEERKRNLEEINKWIKDENDKRMAEAEALKARMEREKAELREFMERDNKAVQVPIGSCPI